MSILTGVYPGINLATTSTSKPTRGAAPHSLVQSRGIGGRVSAPQIADSVPEFGAEAKRTKVQIYRPGKAPKWADEPANDDTAAEPVLTSTLARKRKLGAAMATREALAGDIQAKLLKVELDGKSREGAEPRRKRVAKVIEAEEPPIAEPVAPPAEAAPVAPSIDTTGLEVPQAEEAVEDDDREARRRRVRERLRRKEQEEAEAAAAVAALQAQQAVQAPAEEAEGEEAEEEEEEESSEEDEELIPGRVLFKPLFVSKKDRATIAERERSLADEAAAEAAGQARLEERRQESKQLVIQEVVRDEQRRAAGGVGEDGDSQALPDDRDLEADAEAELEAWKLRELKRVLRDEQQRQEREAEEAANKSRKDLTDEQIAALNRADPNKQKKAGQYKYLQKFYHKGSYYLDETEEVFRRDFTAATGVDAGVDKLALPKVMQVKKFGLKGRTKYTHLVDQDTSQKEANPWAEAEKMGQASRLAGTGGFNKGKKDR